MKRRGKKREKVREEKRRRDRDGKWDGRGDGEGEGEGEGEKGEERMEDLATPGSPAGYVVTTAVDHKGFAILFIHLIFFWCTDSTIECVNQ